MERKCFRKKSYLYKKEGSLEFRMYKKEVIYNLKKACLPIEPANFSHAVKAGPFVFTSGHTAFMPGTSEIDKKAHGNVGLQTHQTLEVLKGILEDAGSSLEDVLLTKIYLTDINGYYEMNKVYSEYFPKREEAPARMCMEISALAKPELLVEIEMIALAHQQ